MANINLKFGDKNALGLSGTGELERFLKPNLSLLFKIREGLLSNITTETFEQVGDAAFTANFQTDQSAEWAVGGPAKVSIGFHPSASGTIAIQKGGEIFHYSQGEDQTSFASVPIPSGRACVSIKFQVGLSVTGGVAFSSGNFGVSGSASAGTGFTLANHRIFPLSKPVLEAVKETFETFVLPFKVEGVETLNDGDCLEFDFLGKLGVGFGVTYGFSGLFLGGRSNGEIQRSFESPLGKAVLSAKPGFRIGAAFSVTYDHEDVFRVVVQRQKSAGADGASLYLFRGSAGDLGIGVTAGITLSPGARFDLQPNLDRVIDEAAQRLFVALPDGAEKDAAINGFQQKLKQPENAAELQKYVKLANDGINALLEKVEGKIELQVKHDRIRKDAVLHSFQFDFREPEASGGYQLAMEGRYSEAIGKKGVELRPGSFVESLFIRRTGLRLQVFDVFRFSSMTEYFRKSSLVYAGSGMFKLRDTTGVKHESGRAGHEKAVEVFFSAEAATTEAVETISDLVVKLNFIMTDLADAKAAAKTTHALREISPQLAAVAGQIDALAARNQALKVKTTCIFLRSALERLDSDDFVDGRPTPLPHPRDRANYDQYVAAVDTIEAGQGFRGQGFPNLFASYDRWVLYNRTAIDEETSTKPPNRRDQGNASPDVWPSALSAAVSDRPLRFLIISQYLDAAREFMNLCDSLKVLAGDIDEVSTDEQYSALLDSLTRTIERDLPISFYKSTLLALCRASGAGIGKIQSAQTADSFELSFEAVG